MSGKRWRVMRRVDGLSEGIIFLSPRRIPTRRVETRQRLAAAGSEEFAMIDLISEKDRRLRIWHSISNEDLDNFEPKQLRNLGIYGGAQGIWVDKITLPAQKSVPTALPLRFFIQGIITPMIFQMMG